MRNIAVVGAGFTGAIIAHELAEAGYVVDVFERRGHVAGNCYTYRDPSTGIMVHAYGPHIFHTSNEEVWNYVNKWDEWISYVQRTKAISKGQVYSLPINLHTLNQFYNKQSNNKVVGPKEMRECVTRRMFKREKISSFEDQALATIGPEIYKTFMEGYTEKQWGVPPSELPASILKRLPVRFDYNDNYFNDKYQAVPKHGYTYIIQKMLNHPRIRLRLGKHFYGQNGFRGIYDHVFYSGPLDSWFNYALGRLGYRSLRFEEIRQKGDYQGCAIMNYCDREVPWTRITEHKYFEPWAQFEDTIAFKEFSEATTPEKEPFYPVRLVNDKKLLNDYVEMAEKETNVTFVGRLGTYRYLDMHQAIAEALQVANRFIYCGKTFCKMPVFCVEMK